MKTYEQEIIEIIKPLFDDFDYKIKGASDEETKIFIDLTQKNEVPEKCISELKRFYKITNGIPCLEIDIHKPDDPIIFEFWKQNKQLWVGQKDMDMISWKDGNFHLGSAGHLNYGKDYIFGNLLDLLKKGFKDWFQ